MTRERARDPEWAEAMIARWVHDQQAVAETSVEHNKTAEWGYACVRCGAAEGPFNYRYGRADEPVCRGDCAAPQSTGKDAVPVAHDPPEQASDYFAIEASVLLMRRHPGVANGEWRKFLAFGTEEEARSFLRQNPPGGEAEFRLAVQRKTREWLDPPAVRVPQPEEPATETSG